MVGYRSHPLRFMIYMVMVPSEEPYIVECEMDTYGLQNTCTGQKVRWAPKERAGVW